VGDWIIGLTGKNLAEDRRLIFCMQVSEKLSFQQYWDDLRFRSKRPTRNGSLACLVGDNIYHRENGVWVQEDSHHSLTNGSPNPVNLKTDTKADAVLIGERFKYFGASAIPVPEEPLSKAGYSRIRDFRKAPLSEAAPIIDLAMKEHEHYVIDDPFHFDRAASRYSGEGNRIIDD
jgi:hypothetical protein